MRNSIRTWVAAVLLGCCVGAMAQEEGMWRASNQTAKSITGDIIFSGEKLTINFLGFTVAKIRALTNDEILAAYSPENGVTGNGNLYRVSISGERKFLHKNTLCGSDDVSWMATYVSGRTLEIKFFSGQKPPVFTPEALTDSSELCGTYVYSR